MFGDNPKRPPEKGEGTLLFVKEIFKTLQGEGPNTGQPAVFLRLGGCNLACSFCDTDFEQYSGIALNDILTNINSLATNANGKRVINLVVVTGGEPFRQKIGMLCEELIKENFMVQIETNGTLYNKIPKKVEIICSPKIVNNSFLAVHHNLKSRINAFKFLLSTKVPGYNKIADYVDFYPGAEIFIQPMDEYDIAQNRENARLAIDMAIDKGYRLSYQLHKILKIS